MTQFMRYLSLSLISIVTVIKAYGADLEMKLNTGGTLKPKLGEFTAPRGGIMHGENTTATIDKNPKSSPTFGIDASLFFNDFIGVNIGVQHAEYKVSDSIISLQDPTLPLPPVYKTGFPGFTTKVTSIHSGIILKQTSLLNPYVGINFVLGLGTLNNTHFDTVPSKYGVGGNKTGLIMLGGMLKTGINYYLSEAVSVGVEYRYQYLKITDTNQQFRSFNQGFRGSLGSSSLLFQVGYRFKI